VLFEALTGDLPHVAHSIPELFTKKVLEAPRQPTSLVPDIDPELERIVVRELSSDRESRHPNARALREELRKLLARLEGRCTDGRSAITAPRMWLDGAMIDGRRERSSMAHAAQRGASC
jgi:serine/threonine-protein kinase